MHRARRQDSCESNAALPFLTSSPRQFVLLVAVELAVLAALISFLHWSGHTGPQLALIPTLIALTAKKFFGNKEEGDSVFGEHPAVAFTFEAFATGEFKDVDEMVAEDFAAYANGYPVIGPENDNGPVRFVENIQHWRRVVPDLSVDIYDEVSQKDADKTDSIAVRFVFTGTLSTQEVEHEFEVEAASFIKVEDHKLTEWRVVVDTAFLDELQSAFGHPLP